MYVLCRTCVEEFTVSRHRGHNLGLRNDQRANLQVPGAPKLPRGYTTNYLLEGGIATNRSTASVENGTLDRHPTRAALQLKIPVATFCRVVWHVCFAGRNRISLLYRFVFRFAKTGLTHAIMMYDTQCSLFLFADAEFSSLCFCW